MRLDRRPLTASQIVGLLAKALVADAVISYKTSDNAAHRLMYKRAAQLYCAEVTFMEPEQVSDIKRVKRVTTIDDTGIEVTKVDEIATPRTRYLYYNATPQDFACLGNLLFKAIRPVWLHRHGFHSEQWRLMVEKVYRLYVQYAEERDRMEADRLMPPPPKNNLVRPLETATQPSHV